MTKRAAWKRRTLLGVAGGLLALPMLRTVKAAASQAPVAQPAGSDDAAFIERAFALQREAIDSGDQGYGAVVVRAGKIVGQAASHVVLHQDPTAHAEMEAIRDAARRLDSRDLSDCILYSSSPPCPMCAAAAYWAGIERMVHGSPARDGGKPRLCG